MPNKNLPKNLRHIEPLFYPSETTLNQMPNPSDWFKTDVIKPVFYHKFNERALPKNFSSKGYFTLDFEYLIDSYQLTVPIVLPPYMYREKNTAKEEKTDQNGHKSFALEQDQKAQDAIEIFFDGKDYFLVGEEPTIKERNLTKMINECSYNNHLDIEHIKQQIQQELSLIAKKFIKRTPLQEKFERELSLEIPNAVTKEKLLKLSEKYLSIVADLCENRVRVDPINGTRIYAGFDSNWAVSIVTDKLIEEGNREKQASMEAFPAKMDFFFASRNQECKVTSYYSADHGIRRIKAKNYVKSAETILSTSGGTHFNFRFMGEKLKDVAMPYRKHMRTEENFRYYEEPSVSSAFANLLFSHAGTLMVGNKINEYDVDPFKFILVEGGKFYSMSSNGNNPDNINLNLDNSPLDWLVIAPSEKIARTLLKGLEEIIKKSKIYPEEFSPNSSVKDFSFVRNCVTNGIIHD